MKIAICDDERNDLLQLRKLVKQYNAELNVTLFSSAKNLLSAAQNDFFDLIFLDIEMEAPNGYEAAEILMQGTDKPLIIFVTNSGEYTLRGYGVAFRYLTKPVDFKKIAEVMNAALAQLTPQKIIINVDGVTHILSFREISYIEIQNHWLSLHLQEKVYTFRGNLKDIEVQLPSGWFAKPHNSYFVNLNEVDHVDTKDVFLTSGAKIPLSQRNRKSFEAALMQFVRRG